MNQKKPKVYVDLSMLMQVSYLTGVQRVVREVVLRLLKKTDREIILLAYNSENENFKILDRDAFLDFFENNIGSRAVCYTKKSIEFDQLPVGSVFFDIDSTWNCRLTRSKLYPILRKCGVQIVTEVHDILPITEPQYCHENTVMRFIAHIGAVLQYASKIICATQATADAVSALCQRLGLEMPAYGVVPLGCDFKKTGVNAKKAEADKDGTIVDELDEAEKMLTPNPDVSDIIAAGKYILMVGTIEPRKNHKLVIDALDAGMKLNVVFAGKAGWNVEELLTRVKKHPLYEKRLFMIHNANDAAINELYENAYLLAFPTFNEGFGLPMIEAFQRGTPVIASDIPVLREVGGDYADYFDNTDCQALVTYTDNCLENEALYQQKREKLKQYQPFTWDACADGIYEILKNADLPGIASVPQLKQMVVLTARHEDIMASLPFIEAFMPFIQELVVCCPEWNVEPFRKAYHGNLKLTFRTDDQLLKGRPLPEDHQARNFFLRCMMMELDCLDDVFIMTDDDYRPMSPITEETFLKDGRYIGYYFYDLREWQGSYGHYTSFDEGAFRTRDFLMAQGYPTLQYSSHQPQIIDKRIFQEMLKTHPGIENHAYDEWSTYFNFGMYHHPELFSAKVNVSMCWPGKLTSWNLYAFPGPFLFENFYAEMYEDDNIFAGFSPTYHENIQAENREKSYLFQNAIRQQFEERKAFDSYSRMYADEYGEFPSIIIYIDGKTQKLQVHVPEFIHFQTDCWTRVPVRIRKEVYQVYAGKVLRVAYHFRNVRNIPVLNSPKVLIGTGDTELMLPVRSPKTHVKKGKMLFRAIIDEPEALEAEKAADPLAERIPAIEDIGKLIPVTLA